MPNKLSNSARIAEVNGTAQRVICTWNEYKNLEKTPFLSTIMQNLSAQNAALTTAINQDKVLNEIDEADSARDAAVRNLGTYTKGCSVLSGENSEAATTLYEIFEKYGKKITGLANNAESSMIDSMLEDFSSEKAKEALSAFPETASLIEKLKDAQDAFQKKASEYSEAVVKKGQSASLAKKKVLEILNERLVPFFAMTENDAEYSEFVKRAQSEIDKMNEVVSERTKAKAKKLK